MTWLRRLLSGSRLEKDLDRELSFHVDRLADEFGRAGMPPGEARRRALLRFGGIEATKEAARDARGTRWLEDAGRDLRYAVRVMRRAKGFTAAALLSLAFGIGANAGVFSVIEALLLRPLPIANPADVVFLDRTGFDAPNLRFSHPELARLAAEIPEASFAGMGSSVRMQLSRPEGAELVIGQLVTGTWFDVLGVRAAAGRLLAPADDHTLGGSPVAVLSDAFWTREFGRDPAVLGRSVRLNGLAITVVGVAPPRFSGLTVGEAIDVWLPVTMQHELRQQGNASINNADIRKPWVPQDGIEWPRWPPRAPPPARPRAASRIDASYRRHLQHTVASIVNPERRAYRLREHVVLMPGARGLSDLRDTISPALLVLMATVALLLLVACANLANLLLARTSARSSEFALRLALGASRARIAAQLLTESLLVAVVAGVAAIGFARWSGRALLRLASPDSTPIPLDLPLDGRLLAFALGAALVTGVLFGLAPVVRLFRTDDTADLRTARRVVGADRGVLVPFTRVLVVAQVALSVALLIGAALFVRTFGNLLSVDAGFDRQHVLSVRVDPRIAGFTERDLPGLYDRLIERARLVPGASSAALALSGPVSGSSRTSSFTIEGRPTRIGDDECRVDFVSAGYFATLGTRLLRGRLFTEHDDQRGAPVAIVNDAMVRHFFGQEDPIGRRIGDDTPTIAIVGVVQDTRVDGPREPAIPMIYYPLKQKPGEYVRNLYVRVAGPPQRAVADVRRAVAAADANLAVRAVATLEKLTERQVSQEKLVSELTAVFGLLAVAVACLGLYGTVSYSVARRTNEVGIRLALGASPGTVRWMVLAETAGLLAAGGCVGLALAAVGLRAAGSLLYGLSAHDPASLLGATALVMAVGLLASAVPAWRASRIDPVAALRGE
jgi:predicted permease